MLRTLSNIGYLMMVGGIVGLIFIHCLLSSSLLVIGPQVAAFLLMVWARLTFGRRSFHFTANPTEGELVTVGPYRLIRHPIYSAVCLFTLAGVAAHWSWPSGALFGLVLGGALMRLRCEEILLAARYPQYADYAAKTWRLIPYVF